MVETKLKKLECGFKEESEVPRHSSPTQDSNSSYEFYCYHSKECGYRVIEDNVRYCTFSKK